MIEVVLLLP